MTTNTTNLYVASKRFGWYKGRPDREFYDIRDRAMDRAKEQITGHGFVLVDSYDRHAGADDVYVVGIMFRETPTADLDGLSRYMNGNGFDVRRARGARRAAPWRPRQRVKK